MRMNLPVQSITKEDLHFAGFHDDNLPTYIDAKPQLLIGLDNVGVTAPIKTFRKKNIVMHETPLGWTIEGTLGTVDTSNRTESVNNIQTMSELFNIVGQFIENENIGIDPKRPTLEPADSVNARQILKNTITKLSTGYEVGLLWRSEQRPRPNNKIYAVHRLLAFERKLQQDPNLRMKANKIIRGYAEKQYIKQVIPSPGEAEWYLPIFAVHTSDKTRLVWDAAAKYKDTSLNDMLLKGPDMNEPMWNILHRFREQPIAVCADVSEMFHRISVAPEDRRYQRFLWREQPGQAIQSFEMTVQTFGAASSPCIAQYVKNENARKFNTTYPLASKSIIENTYVDDWVQSCKDESTAIQLAEQVREIQLSANFHLHKWMSNSDRVLAAIENQSEARLTEKVLQKNKALGVKWNLEDDNLRFAVNNHDLEYQAKTVPTKREMLSLVMSLFDPLGLVAPFAITGRLILREVWKLDCEWDDKIPVCCRQMARIYQAAAEDERTSNLQMVRHPARETGIAYICRCKRTSDRCRRIHKRSRLRRTNCITSGVQM